MPERPALTGVTVGEKGLTEAQIAAIVAIRPPTGEPVDAAVVFQDAGYRRGDLEDAFAFSVIKELKKSPRIRRVVPLPGFIIPSQLTFDGLQELGIRSLCGYVLVFNFTDDDLFKSFQVVSTEWQIQSLVSFIVIDSKTSALIATDKLFSSQRYKPSLFNAQKTVQVQRQVFAEQAGLLATKVDQIFAAPRTK